MDCRFLFKTQRGFRRVRLDLRSIFKPGTLLYLLSFCLMLAVFPLEISAQSVDESQPTSPQLSNPRVLVLHSYHEGFTWTDNVTRGIRSVFTKEAPDVELLFEFMDVKRLYTDEYLHELREFYRFKYAGQKIDAMISSDDHALEFLLGVGQDFFPNVPVVFCAVNGYDPARHRSNGRQLTGVVESIDIKATLEIALKFHPKTKEVAVITDQTLTGRALKASAERIFKDYEDRVRFTYLEHLTMEQLWQEVSALPRESFVFAFIFTHDQFGRIWSHEYNLERLATRCKVPIYSVWEFYLGHGITGGMLTSGQAHGEMAAQMALRILRGENVSEIPVVLESPNRYMFDDNHLRRFGVAESNLPEKSIVINKPFSVYEEYKHLIWGVISVIALLLAIVAILVEDIMLRRRAEKALKNSREQLELITDKLPALLAYVDSEARYLYVNQAYADWYTRSKEEFVGKYVKDVLDEKSYQGAKKYIEAVLQGQELSFENISYDSKGKLRAVRSTYVPHFDENEHVKAFLGLVEDITDRKQAEEELRLFKTIVEASQESVAISDSNGQLFYVNPAHEKLFGRALEEAKTLNYRDYYPPEAIEILNHEVGHALARGESWEGILDAFDATGRRFPLWERAGSILDETGKMIYGFGFMHDETERKQMEEALQKSEERYRTLVESSSDSIYVLDREWRHLIINKAATEFVHMSKEQLVGNKLTELFPGVEKTPFYKTFQKVMKTREPDSVLNEYVFEDGRRGFYEVNVSPVPEGILCVSRDITERKRAEEALQESERNLKEAQKIAHMGSWVLDLKTNKFTVSEEMIRIYKYENMYTDSVSMEEFAKYIHPEDRERVSSALNDSIAGKAAYDLEFCIFRTDGEERILHAQGRVIKDQSGRPIKMVGIGMDITERKRAEDEIRKLNAELEQRVQQRTAELEAANQELKDFAYVVSHDLKAPLRGISQLSQWLVQDYGDAFDEEGQKMVDLLINRVKRMDGLIGGILEYSRIGRIVGKDVEINLDHLVSEVIDSIAPPARIQILIKSELPVIVGDKTRITEVFQNLIENAVKFMDKPEGEICIDCADEGSCWKFRVVDNGPGIEKKYHEKIFQIFQTLEPRDVRESTGVGLALVKKIVEFYGGKIWVESMPGKGSTFSFTLPKKGAEHDEQ